MVSLINFGGGVKQVNGRNVISGSQSGYDTASLVEGLATAKRIPATKFEDNIKINNNKISALTELKSRLTTLKTSVAAFKGSIAGSTTTNAFDARNAFLSMSSGDTASNYLGAVTANGAPIGKYDVKINQVATKQTDLSESFASLEASVVANGTAGGVGTGKFSAGTFNISYYENREIDISENFASQTASVVTPGGGAGMFGTGTFNINYYDDKEIDLSSSFASISTSVVEDGGGAGIFGSGSFDITYYDDAGAAHVETISLTAGQNLTDVKNAINAVNGTTGVTASIVQVASGDYRLKLSADEDGSAVGLTNDKYSFAANTGTTPTFTNYPPNSLRPEIINLETGDSLKDVKDAINAKSAKTGVEASIVRISDTQYQLKLSAVDTGSASGQANDMYSFTAGTGVSASFTNYAPLAARTESIKLTAGSNLATVRDAINAKSTTTGVEATIIKISDTDYRLKLAATETGIAIGQEGAPKKYSLANGTGELVGFTTTAPENAEIILDGNIASPITRTSNIITDLISNTTLTLYQETSGATITLDIDKNEQGIATGMGSFFDAYNEIRSFAALQSEVDADGKPKETAYLKNSTIMQTMVNKLASIVSGSKGAGLLSPDELKAFSTGNSLSAPKALADLGIYFSDTPAVTEGDAPSPAVDNLLTLDASKLTSYLQKYFTETRNIFEFKYSSDNADVNLYKRSNVIYDKNIAGFTINMNHTAGTATVSGLVDANGDDLSPSTATLTYTVSGNSVTLKGQDGTAMEGMQFFYTGEIAGTSTANITVSQGVGDVMFNSIQGYVDNIDGNISAIDQEIENLKTQNKSAQDSVDRIDSMVTSYRETMLQKFSALEALISASNSTLTLLDSQANARNNG